MEKLDLKKQLRFLCAPSARQVEVVDVPELQFLAIDGRLRPGETPDTSTDFGEAIAALYGAAYTLKFMSKLRPIEPVDYPVMALEGLWETSLGDFDFASDLDWSWTLMIMQPDHVTEEMLTQAVAKARKKREYPAFDHLCLEWFREGLCIQVMHMGPYAEEPRTIERLKAFALENGLRLRGRHHAIYRGDPRRAKPDRLRTVLRYPVEKAECPTGVQT